MQNIEERHQGCQAPPAVETRVHPGKQKIDNVIDCYAQLLTPLDLVVGLPVNGLIAPCAPSPSFWASYFNRIFSYISLSLSLSFRKYLLVAKHREGILKGLALASRAI